MFIVEKVTEVGIPDEAILERQWETRRTDSKGMSGKQANPTRRKHLPRP